MLWILVNSTITTIYSILRWTLTETFSFKESTSSELVLCPIVASVAPIVRFTIRFGSGILRVWDHICLKCETCLELLITEHMEKHFRSSFTVWWKDYYYLFERWNSLFTGNLITTDQLVLDKMFYLINLLTDKLSLESDKIRYSYFLIPGFFLIFIWNMVF